MIERAEALTVVGTERSKRAMGTDPKAYIEGPWVVQTLMVNVVELGRQATTGRALTKPSRSVF